MEKCMENSILRIALHETNKLICSNAPGDMGSFADLIGVPAREIQAWNKGHRIESAKVQNVLIGQPTQDREAGQDIVHMSITTGYRGGGSW
jgi:hypothetical protein